MTQAPKLFDCCAGCDYSLEGLPDAGVCPECGRAYDPEHITLIGVAAGSLATANNARWRTTIAWMAIFVFCALPPFLAARSWSDGGLLYLVSVVGVLFAIMERLSSNRRGTVEVLIWPEGVLQKDLASKSVFRPIGMIFCTVILLLGLAGHFVSSPRNGIVTIGIMVSLAAGIALAVRLLKKRQAVIKRPEADYSLSKWERINRYSLRKIDSDRHRINLSRRLRWGLSHPYVDAIVPMTDTQAAIMENVIKQHLTKEKDHG